MFKLLKTSLLIAFLLNGIIPSTGLAVQCLEVFKPIRSSRLNHVNASVTREWVSENVLLTRVLRQSDGLDIESLYSQQFLLKDNSPPTAPLSVYPMYRSNFGMGSVRNYETSNLDPFSQTGKAQSDPLFLDSVRNSFKEISDFIKEQYGRRKWGEEFSESASRWEKLLDRIDHTYQTTIRDPNGKIIASGAVVYSPTIYIKHLEMGKNYKVPWMGATEFIRLLESESFQGQRENTYSLPVEKFFEVEIQRQEGLEVARITNSQGSTFSIELGLIAELSSFAIDVNSGFRKQALEDLYFNFLLASYHTPFSVTTNSAKSNLAAIQANELFAGQGVFFTYGDSIGQRLYTSRPFSFDKIEGLELIRDDVNWRSMAQGKDFLKDFANNKGLADVARKAFYELANSGIPIDNPRFSTPSMRSQTEDIADILRMERFEREFLKVTDSQMLPLFIDFVQKNPTIH